MILKANASVFSFNMLSLRGILRSLSVNGGSKLYTLHSTFYIKNRSSFRKP